MRFFRRRDTDFTFIRVVIDYSPWARAQRYGQLGVARHVIDSFRWPAGLDGRADPGFVVVEAWAGADFHLCVRHRPDGRLLGARLDVGPASALPLDPTARGTSSPGSTQLASHLHHGGFDTGPDPGPLSWCDALGHDWWGEPPGAGWAAALAGERVVSRPA